MCRTHGLKVSGNKLDLIERLWAFQNSFPYPDLPRRQLAQPAMTDLFHQRRVRGFQDRDHDFESPPQTLHDDEDEAEAGGAAEQACITLVRDTLAARKIVDLGSPVRFSAEIHLHLSRCDLFMQIVQRTRKIIQDVEGPNGRKFELTGPPQCAHRLDIKDIDELKDTYRPKS